MVQDGFDLALQRHRIERLDNVVIHARLFRGDHVFGFAFCRDHDERGFMACRADSFEKIKTCHAIHIPVRQEGHSCFLSSGRWPAGRP